MGRLDHKVAIITGGARGIGLAAVEKFVNEGAFVAIWDVDPVRGDQTIQAICSRFPEATDHIAFQEVNVADYSKVEQAASRVVERWQRVDILINNAGITRDATMKKMSLEQWQAVIDVNLSGVFHCTRAVVPAMLERNFGRIINTTSVVALYGNFGQTNYVAAKAGVIGMTKVWAREFGRKGITVNAVAPGFIATDMVNTIPAKVIEVMVEKTPVGRLGQPEDIANAYLFLASDEASFINGAVLSVDGGVVL